MTRLLSIILLSLSLLSLEAADVNITNVTHATSIASTDWLLGLTNGAGGDSRLIPTSLFPLLSANNTFTGNLNVTGATTLGTAKINSPGSAATVVNVGLDASGNVVTNAIPVGVGGGGSPFDGQSIAGGTHGTFLDSETNSSEIIGWLAGQSATNTQNVMIGPSAGQYATNAWGNVYLGNQAGLRTWLVNNSVFIGSGAGAYATGAIQSEFIGDQAGLDATNATFSQFIGAFSGQEAWDAQNATGVGDNALQYSIHGQNTTAVGAHSGVGTTNADGSVYIGFHAGRYAVNSRVSVFSGDAAGENATNADHSVFSGYASGQGMFAAASSIFLGPYSGTNRANTLWIDTQSSVADGSYQPMIYGEFDNRLLRINGKLLLNGGMAYTTNQNQIVPDFTLPCQLTTTNAAFTFLAPVGIDASKTTLQTTAVYVTNTTAAAVVATAPANCHPVGTMYVTNVTRFTFECYAQQFTNCFAVPIF